MSKKKEWAHLTKGHKQEIYFDNGSCRVIRNIVHVERGNWVHLVCDGEDHGADEIIVNPDRVLFIRVNKEEK